MNSSEVAVHEVQCHGIDVILNLLTEAVRQARKPPHAHPHREILSFDVAGRNVLRIGLASDRSYGNALDLSGAVASLWFAARAIDFNESGVIDAGTKSTLDSSQVSLQAIGC